MKRTVFALLIMLSVIARGQAQDKIEGIGRLKIGRPTMDVISELSQDYNGKIKEIEDDSFEGNGSAVYKLIYTTNAASPVQASACPSTEVYYVKQYAKSGLKLTDVYLYFYEGVLIRILGQGSDELDKAVAAQYGSPTRSVTEEQSDCQQQRDKTVTDTWKNGAIAARMITCFDYATNCRLTRQHYFSIQLLSEEANAAECDQASEDKQANNKGKVVAEKR